MAQQAAGEDHRQRLAGVCAGGYLIIVLLASLYPFAGWRSTGTGMFAYLSMAWPAYHTPGDVELNVLGYLPLGVLLGLALERQGRRVAVGLATLLPGALSVLLEGLQTYLPARVPSKLDVLANLAGAGIGAVLTVEGWQRHGRSWRSGQGLFRPGPLTDVGLIVLLLWLFTQLNPEVALFATGDLGHLFGLLPELPYQASAYFLLELAITALNLTAALMLAALLTPAGAPWLRPLAGLLGAALGVKTLASFALFAPGGATLWMTRAAALGLALGAVLFLGLQRAPRRAAIALCALALLVGLLLVNLVPPNPYLQASAHALQYGHFASFRAITRLVSALWPLLSLAYLLTLWGECRSLNDGGG